MKTTNDKIFLLISATLVIYLSVVLDKMKNDNMIDIQKVNKTDDTRK